LSIVLPAHAEKYNEESLGEENQTILLGWSNHGFRVVRDLRLQHSRRSRPHAALQIFCIPEKHANDGSRGCLTGRSIFFIVGLRELGRYWPI